MQERNSIHDRYCTLTVRCLTHLGYKGDAFLLRTTAHFKELVYIQVQGMKWLF